jgi:hypothetical protein
MFCFRQILVKMRVYWGSTAAIYRLQKASVTVMKVILCSIFTEFDVPLKLVRLIKMCLKESYTDERT